MVSIPYRKCRQLDTTRGHPFSMYTPNGEGVFPMHSVCTHQMGRGSSQCIQCVHTKWGGGLPNAFSVYTPNGEGVFPMHSVCTHQMGRGSSQCIQCVHTKWGGGLPNALRSIVKVSLTLYKILARGKGGGGGGGRKTFILSVRTKGSKGRGNRPLLQTICPVNYSLW